MAIRPPVWAAIALLIAALPARADTELTLNEAIARAIAHNIDFAADRLDRDQAELSLRQARDRYGLDFTVSSGTNQNVSPSSSTLSGVSQLSNNKDSLNLALSQSLSTNGTLGLNFNNGLSTTNDVTSAINPAYSPSLSLGFNQPLLRDAWTGTKLIRQADIGLSKARLALRDRVMRLVTDTASAYWDLVSQRESYAVLQRSLEASKQLLAANQAKEKSGFLAQIDVVQAQASVASTETDLLDQERQVLNAEDRLRRLILSPDDAEGWQGKLVPTDLPTFRPEVHPFDAVRQTSLAHRPDYLSALLDVEARRIDTAIARQGMLPGLALNLNGGVQQLSNQYGQAVSNLGTLQNYFVSAGLTFDLPVTRPTTRDAYDKAALSLRQTELRAKAAERQLFTDLRQDLRNVEIGAKRLAASQAARELAAKQLEAEREKLDLGLSTNFQVITYQKALDDASLRANNALIEAIKAEIELKRLMGTLLDGMPLPEDLR